MKSMEWTSLHDLLVAGDVDLVARKPTSLWSNRLVLPGIDVIDHAKFDSEEKIEASRETLSLRGRHLEGAVLIGSNLRKADLTAARLQGAKDGSPDRHRFPRGTGEVPCRRGRGFSMRATLIERIVRSNKFQKWRALAWVKTRSPRGGPGSGPYLRAGISAPRTRVQ